jgi:hypothetical protein
VIKGIEFRANLYFFGVTMGSGLQAYISTALRYSTCCKVNMVYILPHSVILLFEVLKSRINTNIKVFMVQETEFECGVECVILLGRLLLVWHYTCNVMYVIR